jgi:hypothetical protein
MCNTICLFYICISVVVVTFVHMFVAILFITFQKSIEFVNWMKCFIYLFTSSHFPVGEMSCLAMLLMSYTLCSFVHPLLLPPNILFSAPFFNSHIGFETSEITWFKYKRVKVLPLSGHEVPNGGGGYSRPDCCWSSTTLTVAIHTEITSPFTSRFTTCHLIRTAVHELCFFHPQITQVNINTKLLSHDVVS